MKRLPLILAAALLSGCQAAAVKPDAVAESGLPPKDMARPFGAVTCWRVVIPEVPATKDAWPAMCVPTAAIQGCIETPKRFHCPQAQARRNLMGASH